MVLWLALAFLEFLQATQHPTTSLAANASTQLTIYVDTDENYTGPLTNIATINGTDGFVNVNSDNSSGPVTVNITARVEGPIRSVYLPLVVEAASPTQ